MRLTTLILFARISLPKSTLPECYADIVGEFNNLVLLYSWFADWPWLPCIITNVMFQPPIGFSIATSIRVGNELGAGNPNAAKKASYLAVVCVCKYTLNCVHT